MSKPKISIVYFPFAGRAEPLRLACVMGSVPFTNECVGFEEFAALKPSLPNGQLPVMYVEDDGVKKVYGQSNAILRYIGKLGGLYPEDPTLAMEIDAVLDLVEDFTSPLAASLYFSRSLLGEKDFNEEEKMSFRKRFTDISIPRYFTLLEDSLAKSASGWVCGDNATIADARLFQVLQWLTSGMLDGIPSSCISNYPKLVAFMDKMKTYPPVQSWYEKKGNSPYVTSDYVP